MVWWLRHIFNGVARASLSFFALAAAAEPLASLQLPPAQPHGLPYPIIGAEHKLSGKSLIDELRKGGYVLYMRHAETGRVTEQCGVSNLTPAGEEAAKQIGAAIRALNIAVAEIWSAPACRVLDTARLLDLGNVKLTDDLAATSTNPGFDLVVSRQRRLDTRPAKGTNIVLVSHMHGGNASHEWLQLAIGETIVFHPNSNSPTVPVARILAQDWESFLAINKN